MIRKFGKPIIKGEKHCNKCGLLEDLCICDYDIKISSNIRFILLTHENEFAKRTNTGRLIENAFENTCVIKWSRVEPSRELLRIISEEKYVYLLYPESDEEKSRECRIDVDSDLNKSDHMINIIIIDGTWQESVKIYNRSSYLQNIKRISLDNVTASEYKLRRKKALHQLCTVEAAIEVLKKFDESSNASILSEYFKKFQDNYK